MLSSPNGLPSPPLDGREQDTCVRQTPGRWIRLADGLQIGRESCFSSYPSDALEGWWFFGFLAQGTVQELQNQGLALQLQGYGVRDRALALPGFFPRHVL